DLGMIGQRSQILWQARSSKSKAGPKVGRRNIQFAILAEDIHHRMRVDVEGLAYISNFIRESNLQCVPAVVNVFDHLSRIEIGPDQRRFEVTVKSGQDVAAEMIQFADDGLWRAAKVLHRRAFPQKFRVVADTEIHTCLLP